MKRILVLLGCIPLFAAPLVLSGCGDGVEPRPPAATPTRTVAPPTATRTVTATPTITNTPVPPTLTPTSSGPVNTPTETSTPGQETPTAPPETVCGDGIIEGTETCDDGGICQNGADNGKPCPAGVDSVPDGVNCAAPGVCRPVGGDGCAENCTTETIIDLDLGDTSTSKSMSEVQGKAFGVPLVLTGKLRARAGQPRDEIVTTTAGKTFNPNDIPVVQTVNDNRWTPDTPNQGLPPIAVQPGIACACVRGYAAKSCGALLPDDPAFIDCTPRCLASDGSGVCAGGSNPLAPCMQDSECPGGVCGEICNPNLPEPSLSAQCTAPPGVEQTYTCTNRDDLCTDPAATCDFIHGPGNQASGIIACNGGLTGPTGEGIDYKVVLDSCPPTSTNCLPAITTRTWSGGPAPAGSALIINSTAIGNIQGSTCLEDPTQALNGPDGLPCTDDDLDKSYLNTIPLTTGTAQAEVIDANDSPGSVIGDGLTCGADPCLTKYTGSPLMCSALPSTKDGALAGAFASENLSPLGDVAVPSLFYSIQ